VISRRSSVSLIAATLALAACGSDVTPQGLAPAPWFTHRVQRDQHHGEASAAGAMIRDEVSRGCEAFRVRCGGFSRSRPKS